MTLALLDADGRPVALEMPPRPAPPQPRPTAVGAARPLANCTSVAFDASASTGDGPLAYRWRFGDGARERRAGHRARLRRARPLRGRARGARRAATTSPAAPASRVPVHVRPAPVAAAGDPVTAAPGEPVAFDGTGSTPSDSPITRFHWTFGDGTEAEGATATHAYARARPLPRRCCGSRTTPATPATSAWRPALVTRELPAGRRGRRGAGGGGRRAGDARRRRQLRRRRRGHRATAGTWATARCSTAPPSPTPTRRPGRYAATLTVRTTPAWRTPARPTPWRSPSTPRRCRWRPAPTARSRSARSPGSTPAGSTDADGAILSWSWDFGDGATGEGPAVQYAWAAPGVYPVTLTVTDNSATDSAVSTTTHRRHGQRRPGRRRRPRPVGRGQRGRLRRRRLAATPTARSPATSGASATAPPPPGRNVRHAYARPGTYEVALVVRDDSGAPLNTARDTAIVRVNAAPIADAGPDLVDGARRGGGARRLRLGRSRRRGRRLALALPRRQRGRGRARRRAASPHPACSACS